MAKIRIQYPSTHLTESAGCILIHPTLRRICTINLTEYNRQTKEEHEETLLPKGRRNLHESRVSAAVRETTEETTYKCNLLPITLGSRLTLPEDHEDVRDKVRTHENCTESFYMQIRSIGRGQERRAKIIWWFMATVDEEDYERKEKDGWDGVVKKGVRVEWIGYEDVVGKMAYENDGDVLETALEILKGMENGA
ncbi:hypothetical protein ABW20_dc0102386 [Dactylellina cionopaga]|nr:hypothetical protein ABW20_dc0102386 [Dactylellina cionopaga]